MSIKKSGGKYHLRGGLALGIIQKDDTVVVNQEEKVVQEVNQTADIVTARTKDGQKMKKSVWMYRPYISDSNNVEVSMDETELISRMGTAPNRVLEWYIRSELLDKEPGCLFTCTMGPGQYEAGIKVYHRRGRYFVRTASPDDISSSSKKKVQDYLIREMEGRDWTCQKDELDLVDKKLIAQVI